MHISKKTIALRHAVQTVAGKLLFISGVRPRCSMISQSAHHQAEEGFVALRVWAWGENLQTFKVNTRKCVLQTSECRQTTRANSTYIPMRFPLQQKQPSYLLHSQNFSDWNSSFDQSWSVAFESVTCLWQFSREEFLFLLLFMITPYATYSRRSSISSCSRANIGVME